MDLYAGTVAEFEKDVASERLVPQLEEAYSRQILSNPSASELKSWERSLAALSVDTQEVGLGGCGILIEHMLPLSSKRLDVLLFGSSEGGWPDPLKSVRPV